ncbi:MAG: hypothetical protein Ct9H300mP4_05150 [Gammaproteobacteria bacterium]|nr:MAG: hypothetical protein Ct9H300mP4_05150 [Gammaproteobacteria bacterium]
MHFLSYAIIDQSGDIKIIIVDIIETPYLIVGWGGFLCFFLWGLLHTNDYNLGSTKIDLQSVDCLHCCCFSSLALFLADQNSRTGVCDIYCYHLHSDVMEIENYDSKKIRDFNLYKLPFVVLHNPS